VKLPRPRLIVLAVVLLLLAGGFSWSRSAAGTDVQAYFVSAEGLNVGDDVKVLGVKVGRITGIENRREGVLVSMVVDADQSIPADAHAAIVSPSLVSGRFVQLEPAYDGGPRLADGARIGKERTAVPVTFDDVKQQLTDLATTLGPGKRDDGPLAVAIRAVDRGLARGNSRQLRTAIAELRAAATTLSDGRSDLFTTISHLDGFTRNLAVNDAAVRGFTDRLDNVSTVLADNRSDLRATIKGLAEVLKATDGYFTKHGDRITDAVTDVDKLAATVADRSNELAAVLHIAPHSLIGLHNTVQDQALTARATLSGLDNVAQLLCGAILGAGGTSRQCTDALEPLMDLLGLTAGGDTSGLPLGGKR